MLAASFFTAMLVVDMLSTVMLSVSMPIAVVLRVSSSKLRLLPLDLEYPNFWLKKNINLNGERDN